MYLCDWDDTAPVRFTPYSLSEAKILSSGKLESFLKSAIEEGGRDRFDNSVDVEDNANDALLALPGI